MGEITEAMMKAARDAYEVASVCCVDRWHDRALRAALSAALSASQEGGETETSASQLRGELKLALQRVIKLTTQGNKKFEDNRSRNWVTFEPHLTHAIWNREAREVLASLKEKQT